MAKETYRVVYQDAACNKNYYTKFGAEYKKIEEAQKVFEDLLRHMRQDHAKSNGKVFAGGTHTYSIVNVALIAKTDLESKWRIIQSEKR